MDDLFHEVTMTENRHWQEGYSAGLEAGKMKGFQEGFHLGVEKGIEIGNEVGFYAGFASYVLKGKEQVTKSTSSRVIKVAEAIVQLAESFEDIDPTDERLTDCLSKIQAKFKQLTSLIGVAMEYTSPSDVKGSSF